MSSKSCPREVANLSKIYSQGVNTEEMSRSKTYLHAIEYHVQFDDGLRSNKVVDRYSIDVRQEVGAYNTERHA